MLALVGAALAAPLHPVVLPGGGPDAEIALRWTRDLLVERGCSGCDAWREEHAQTIQAGWQIVPAFGLYGTAEHLRDTVEAAAYEQVGFGFSGGARLDVPLGRTTSVEAWGEVRHAWSGVVDLDGTGDGAARIETEVGGVLRAGNANGGIFGWIGGAVVPWTDDRSLVLDGDYLLYLRPWVPVEGVAGVGYVSDPMGGAWNERGRLTGGFRFSAGWRNSVAAWVGAAF